MLLSVLIEVHCGTLGSSHLGDSRTIYAQEPQFPLFIPQTKIIWGCRTNCANFFHPSSYSILLRSPNARDASRPLSFSFLSLISVLSPVENLEWVHLRIEKSVKLTRFVFEDVILSSFERCLSSFVPNSHFLPTHPAHPVTAAVDVAVRSEIVFELRMRISCVATATNPTAFRAPSAPPLADPQTPLPSSVGTVA